MNQAASLEEQQEESELQAIIKRLEALSTPEEKLKCAVEFMRSSLSRSGSPYFKGFWEVRKVCLPLFKENLPTAIRSQLWADYIELTKEGRRLKDLLDQESAFAAQQIEIAIKSLEEERERFDLQQSEGADLPETSKTIGKKLKFYEDLQGRLNALNTFAARIHALRKELIKTDMRIRYKNKFFERLSTLGDAVFPVRKDLIHEVSTEFMGDVASFVKEHFSQERFSHEEVKAHVFFYREEIKTLQAIAKMLTLNTQAFTTTREELSQCWDQLKGMEKELKKEHSEQKQKSAENTAEVQAKIKEISDAFKENRVSDELVLQQLDEVSRWMRGIELIHYDVKLLKEELRVVHALVEEKRELEERARREKESESEERRREECEKFKQKIEALKGQMTSADVEFLSNELAALKSELANLTMSKREKAVLERALKEMREGIEERREQALINLSDDDKAALEQLREILQQRKGRRQEIKLQLEEYRKIIGGSTLDFEKAIEYGELATQEKERLEKMDESIQELEDKIRELKKKV